MSKPSKKARKRTKDGKKKVVKRKIHKKIGLAKYLQPENKPKKRSDKDEANTSPKKIVTTKIKDKSLSIVDRCKSQMLSSMLRLMDESLYSNEAKSVPLDKEKFLAYHEAYASVCEKWPIKPIDYIVKFIKRRLITPKRPISKYKFADIGCGKEPLLKMKLPPKAKVLSFDLVSINKDVIEANMEKLPIEDGTIHCAIYSLSLMAKNLGNIILEGKRVLKLNGSMLVVEVTSRFEGREKKFASKLERLGLKQKSMTVLQPNGYFTFFHFTKQNTKLDYSNSCLDIQLKPCVYKSR